MGYKPKYLGAVAIKIKDIKKCSATDCKEEPVYIVYLTNGHLSPGTSLHYSHLTSEHMFACEKHIEEIMDGREGGYGFDRLSLVGLPARYHEVKA